MSVLLAGLGLILAVKVTAQTFTNLHNFTGSDGAHPETGLILSGNILYGAIGGGSLGMGTVFAVRTDGTGFTNLYSFSAVSVPNSSGTNSDGAVPTAGLILSSSMLYGIAGYGGSSGNGTVFAISTNGTGFTNLYNFTARSNSTNSDGANPAGLMLSGNTLYGDGEYWWQFGHAVRCSLSTPMAPVLQTCIVRSRQLLALPASMATNSDGAYPQAGLILLGNTFYGVAPNGGVSGWGTIFAVNTDGTGFTNLHNFTALSGPHSGTNSDGANPFGRLILSGNTLYGTTHRGGSSDSGTVFAVNTDGTSFTNLHSFAKAGVSGSSGPNWDGANPKCRTDFIRQQPVWDSAYAGGSSGSGTVFAINTDGTGFTNLAFL